MPTDYQYAMMSNLAYRPQDSERLFADDSGWQWCFGTMENSSFVGEYGLAYSIFRHDGEQHIVIAFRGTDNGQNLRTDFWMAFGYQPNTYPAAQIAVQSFIDNLDSHGLQNYAISFTGHSLGGSLGTMCAVQFNRRAVVFDSASLASSFVVPGDYDEQQIRTFVTSPDAVNTLNPHIGQVRRLSLRPIEDVSWQHAVACTWGTISRTTIMLAAAAYLARKYLLTDAPEDKLEKALLPGPTGLLLLYQAIHYVITGKHAIYTTPLLSLSIGLLGAAPGMTEDYHWLFTRHHAMDLIEDAINPALGAVIAPQVQSWPSFRQHWFINRPMHEVMGFIPFLPSNRGLHTLFRESRVIEAQVDSMVGYRLM